MTPKLEETKEAIVARIRDNMRKVQKRADVKNVKRTKLDPRDVITEDQLKALVLYCTSSNPHVAARNLGCSYAAYQARINEAQRRLKFDHRWQMKRFVLLMWERKPEGV